MKHFCSFKQQLENILPRFFSDPPSHAKWLNTLSYLENCGARKIARCEHPQNVSKEMLKHASEEFRHAFYLKQQISTKLGQSIPNYQLDSLCGGLETLRYLDRLEMSVCRLADKSFHPLAVYFLVTYAIELRASEIYPIYQTLLSKNKSPVSVRSILLEEKGHLEEMREQIATLCIEESTLEKVCQAEAILCQKWLINLKH